MSLLKAVLFLPFILLARMRGLSQARFALPSQLHIIPDPSKEGYIVVDHPVRIRVVTFLQRICKRTGGHVLDSGSVMMMNPALTGGVRAIRIPCRYCGEDIEIPLREVALQNSYADLLKSLGWISEEERVCVTAQPQSHE
jgi:hypothetical protein